MERIADDERHEDDASLVHHVRQIEAHLRAAGLGPNERVLIVCGPRRDALVAAAAVQGLGAVPVFAPVGLSAIDLTAHARAAEAVALLGPTHYGPLELGETYLSVAALVDSIRLVATQGDESVDGALDLSPQALAGQAEFIRPPSSIAAGHLLRIGSFTGPSGAPRLTLATEADLVAAAEQLATAADMPMGPRVLSTLPPTSTASLVAGPFVAALRGGSLRLHGPFDARRFLAACDAGPRPYLVIPGPLAPRFAEATLAAHFAGLVLIWRQAGLPGIGLPPALGCACPIVDLYAFDDDRLVIRGRTGGEAQPLA